MMKRLRIHLTFLAVLLVALVAASPAAAQCDPDGREGQISDVFTGTAALEWRMLVEHRSVTLTVSAPCGLVINRTYKEGQSPFFDLKEISAADPDGRYHWQLHASPHLDAGLEKELRAAHEQGDDGRQLEYQMRQKGLLPQGPFRQSGSFEVIRGAIVPPDQKEEGAGGKSMAGVRPASATSAATCPAAPDVETARLSTIVPAVDRGGSTRPMAAAETPRRITGADQVIPDDLIVQGSLCVGFDCVNNESFGFDTIRLKENNLRIKFEDTSSVAGFPTTDWQLTANDSASGGSNKFSIEDITGARVPFTVTAGAPTNSLFVASTGRVGLRTSSPILDLHINTSNTPGIRLEQNSSGGFTAQTWDIAGNEANFFVRDVTGGSRLPLRIRPGAPTSSIDVSASGNVGLGTTSPTRRLHVITTGAADNTVLEIQNDGPARLRINNGSSGEVWNIGHQTPSGTGLVFSDVGDAVSEMLLDTSGNMTISGTLVTGGPSCGGGCDFVFDSAYPLQSIDEHARQMWENRHLPAVGPTQEGAPFNLTEKTGGILNELETAHIYIEQLHNRLVEKERLLADMRQANDTRLDELANENDELRERLERLEALLK